MITREFIRTVDLFAGLDPLDAEALAAAAKEEVFPKGRAVFREGEAGGALYVVVSGVIEVTKAGVTVARLERGEVLGETAAFAGGPRTATASAAVVPETRLATWDLPAIQRFMAERPRAGLHVLGTLLRRMDRRLRGASEAIQVLVRAL